ncbi:cytidylate kinase [Lichtheimia corymbifera JMRC:FSU:9682]|uniref:(d)CMP kinase n=1 Tax=Lichtheimia corymbifera JMRC:FSU:9682 TaxID=1263082 RepID=A0A068S924_9FUNG|nr:cytidylate kinase [Lichtheimia corymbifera JMRC:FSU:9682]
MSRLFRIAIDGPAASGKSTTAKLLAKKLGFGYIDSGAMYRAVTLKCLDQGVNVNHASEVEQVAKSAKIRFPALGKVELDDKDVSDAIRESRIVQSISPIASNKNVRETLAEQQRSLARGDVDQGWPGFSWNEKQIHGVVMDGRDIGTVILPDAELKVFIVADPKVRAQRRYDELAGKNALASGETVESIAKDLAERDEADRTRKVSPLKKADDAEELDTSFKTIDEQVLDIENMVHKRLNRS